MLFSLSFFRLVQLFAFLFLRLFFFFYFFFLLNKMYLMYTLDEQGKRVYTLKVRGAKKR